jgi:hypothetical protein
MNHDQFRKCIRQTLRLEPRAVGPDDPPVDDDWTVVDTDPQSKAARRRGDRRLRPVVFKVPPTMPSVDPSALVLMRHRN